MLSAFIREQAYCTSCQGKLTVLYNNERGGKKSISHQEWLFPPLSCCSSVCGSMETSQLEIREKYKNVSKLHQLMDLIMIHPLHRSDFLHLVSLFCSSNEDIKFCVISMYLPEKKKKMLKLKSGKCLGEYFGTYSEIQYSAFFNVIVMIQLYAALWNRSFTVTVLHIMI